MEGEIEAMMRGWLQDEQYEQLAAAALDAYGDELYGYLVSRLKAAADADEVFSQAIEDFWRGLPQFQGRASIKTWLYKLAHNAACRFQRCAWNRHVRATESELSELIEKARSGTAPWRRTAVKDKLRELRDALEPDDRSLLILRIDRNLDWKEIALIMLEDEGPSAEALAREAARLRKRFQQVKDDLRTRAIAAGILRPHDERG